MLHAKGKIRLEVKDIAAISITPITMTSTDRNSELSSPSFIYSSKRSAQLLLLHLERCSHHQKPIYFHKTFDETCEIYACVS